MSWSNRQKQTLMVTCRLCRIDDDHRRLVLRQLGDRALVNGRPTSTAPKLNNRDFEDAMATLEGWQGGQLPGFDPNYWGDKTIDGESTRRRFAIRKLQEAIAQLPELPVAPSPATVSRQRTHELDQLDRRELSNLLDAMQAFCRRHSIDPSYYLKDGTDAPTTAK